jgi:hypothetical protein
MVIIMIDINKIEYNYKLNTIKKLRSTKNLIYFFVLKLKRIDVKIV